MDRFFSALRQGLEEHSKRLLRGDIFLPRYLKKGKFTKNAFPPVARQLAKRLRFSGKAFNREVRNPFPEDWKVGLWQQVDYVLGNPDQPKYFLELESLDRTQLYLFLPHGGRKDGSKLWYYWATVCKQIMGDKSMPRYFVWLLILPDQPVKNFPFWDATKYYRLLSPLLRPLVQDNPFRFYDWMIKTSARLFIQKVRWMKDNKGEWQQGRLQDHQEKCELVFLTCTGRQLIMSRGRDGFDPAKEKRVLLKWKR